MRKRICARICSSALAALVLGAAPSHTHALELITAREAALPDSIDAKLNLGFRGVSRAPTVLVLSPAQDAGMVKSPLNLRLKFEPHGGATIDPQLVHITYLKNPAINLTPRIGDMIRADGIEVGHAEVPSGTHYIRVQVMDSAGRLGSTVFALMVGN
jgi:hypothetical protein